MQSLASSDADERLLASARAGDATSFELLIGPHIGAGYRLAAAMLNDPAAAEDAVQEATLHAWRAVSRLRPESRLRPWFLTIVANEARSMRRTRWWSVVRLPQPRPQALAATDPADRRMDLVTALRRLNADERAAIFLRFYEDMDSHEVGQALGISATGARSRIRRGLHRLRVELSKEEL